MIGYAEQIRISQDKDAMLRRALERIIQLYTDRSHFVYELLQNAEDENATDVKFVQYPDRLEVMHDGRPFTSQNLKGLCDIGKSDKDKDLNQIGEFGVGFKSVFGICDKVRLYSEPSHFSNKDIGDAIPFAVEIINFTDPQDIPREEIEPSYTTKFVFPYTVGRSFSGFKTLSELNRTLSDKLQNLGITTLLFMKNLEHIKYCINVGEVPIEGEYLLEKKPINGHYTIVSALGSTGMCEKTEETSYLKFSRRIDEESKRTVDIAFPVTKDKNGRYECQKPKSPYISVYFPTETESKLGFIVQGPYRTTPNRGSIPSDDDDNIRLANETKILLRKSLLELRDRGELNMSFIKALPISSSNFDSYGLFEPLYDDVKNLFFGDNIIPCKNGGYVSAKRARIARQEKLATVFSDELLTELIHDGDSYCWLPTYLTETNREYEAVYKYLTSVLKIAVIRPEDLRTYFTRNPEFLPQCTDDWLIELYILLENVGAAFNKATNEANMLTADIVKTSTGQFVAAYRKTENKQYLPNIFLPSGKVQSTDINFVDSRIYEHCRNFFDNVLQLQKPDEYEFFISDIKKRYSGQYIFDEQKHIEDIRRLCEYLEYKEYKEDISRIISELIVLRCKDGIMRNAYRDSIYLSISQTGIQIEGYLRNIAKTASFVDTDFYTRHDITVDMLCNMGVQSSLLLYENMTSGLYYTGNRGKTPEWWTSGDFRWKLMIKNLKEAIKYISKYPTASDSIIKSQTIFKILLENESKLMGRVNIKGNTPDLENEPCEAIHVLRGERTVGWNGKWLFTEAMELVAPKNVTRYDISTAFYGKLKLDSPIYKALGFRKAESDEVAALRETVPKEQLEAYFEDELRKRFGMNSTDISERLDRKPTEEREPSSANEPLYPFPIVCVKNWEALKKHAAEMLCYADPVQYDYAVRRIRVSNHLKESRAYLLNMYRYDDLYKYACQMCHDSCSNIEVAEIFNKPKTELDPMNLCLCPNCAAIYRQSRNNSAEMEAFRRRILALKDTDISEAEYVAIEVDDQEIWFTQTHIAEIRELLQLEIDVSNTLPTPVQDNSSESKSGLSVYSSYIGKRIKRKDGFLGEIEKVDDGFIYVKVLSGNKPGKVTKIQLSFLTKNPGKYEVFDAPK